MRHYGAMKYNPLKYSLLRCNLLIYNPLIYITLSCIFVAYGCSGKYAPDEDSSGQIRFSVEYPGAKEYPGANGNKMAKEYSAATKVSAEGFESGDVVGLYMTEYEDGKATALNISGNAVNNETLTFDGISWSPKRKIWWTVGTLYDAYGYYPAGEPYSVEAYPFRVAEDQTVEGAYESSDFLWAKAAGVRYPQTVALKFSHRMSRVVINLLKGDGFEGDFPDNLSVRIHGVVADALVNLGTGSVVADPRAAKVTVTARQQSADTYVAILVPQSLTNRQPLVEIQCDGVSYLVEGRMIFRSGVQHQLNITLNSNPDKVRVDVGGEVVDWD